MEIEYFIGGVFIAIPIIILGSFSLGYLLGRRDGYSQGFSGIRNPTNIKEK